MSYLKIDNAKELQDVIKNIKAEKNITTLVSAYEDFLCNFSCTPDRDEFPYPKEGTVINVDKSVRWNMEEVERQRNAYLTKVKELNQNKNLISVNFRDQLAKVLAKENKLNIDESKKLFTYAFNVDYNNGARAVVNTYKNLVKMYKELIDIHDGKNKIKSKHTLSDYER